MRQMKSPPKTCTVERCAGHTKYVLQTGEALCGYHSDRYRMWRLYVELIVEWWTPPACSIATLRPLAVDNPMQTSQEGLDDCCFFCGYDIVYGDRSQPHEVDCTWFTARVALGLSTKGHHRVA